MPRSMRRHAMLIREPTSPGPRRLPARRSHSRTRTSIRVPVEESASGTTARRPATSGTAPATAPARSTTSRAGAPGRSGSPGAGSAAAAASAGRLLVTTAVGGAASHAVARPVGTTSRSENPPSSGIACGTPWVIRESTSVAPSGTGGEPAGTR
ncbi:hypothetical protein ACFQ1L_34420 [Phytohabitans flavus]|uniref:hypothetical protein n=1 Tax=Phytohabitans flavus TaxID=1076124 RepID=UPI00362DCEF5